MKYTVLFVLMITLNLGCSTNWKNVIKDGNIGVENFKESIAIEVHRGLIFVPVEINGEKYNFLFDTGAPTSISEQLQEKYKFKVVSESHIVDTDQNRKKVDWVKIDSLKIGTIPFLDQVAFAGDFDANSILKCLNIDGIIGSNLMQFCNWTVDQDNNVLSFYSSEHLKPSKNSVSLPFQSNSQYSMHIKLPIGKATVNGVLVDYGSNGALALNNKIFSFLKKENIIHNTYNEIGEKQSGIVGNAVPINREICLSDSVQLTNQPLNDVLIKSGNNVSIGNEILSRFVVTIDWENKQLHFERGRSFQKEFPITGFSLKSDDNQKVFIQSITEGTMAYQQGLQPDMQVIQIDTLNFEEDDNFCDFIFYKSPYSYEIEVLDSSGMKKKIWIEKTLLKE